jgi:hypothetical protein
VQAITRSEGVKMSNLSVWAACLLVAAVPMSYTRDVNRSVDDSLYVAKDGSDSNPRTQEEPFPDGELKAFALFI